MIRVTFIEDDKAHAELFQKFVLDDPDFDVLLATDIEAAQTLSPDVILLDLRIPPNQNPDETLAASFQISVPIIALSAGLEPDLEEKALAAGCKRFFYKRDVIKNPSLLQNAIREFATKP